MDSTDSWIEKCEDGKYMREPDKWMDFTEREEIIKRKKKDPVKVVFYENKHGILEGNPNRDGYYITTSWAPAFSGAVTFDSLLRIFDAKTVTEGMDLLGRVETSWNFILADKGGNIGYQMSGLMPKRREGVSGFVPCPAGKKEMTGRGLKNRKTCRDAITPNAATLLPAIRTLTNTGRFIPLMSAWDPTVRTGLGNFFLRITTLPVKTCIVCITMSIQHRLNYS